MTPSGKFLPSMKGLVPHMLDCMYSLMDALALLVVCWAGREGTRGNRKERLHEQEGYACFATRVAKGPLPFLN
jgi:hypothetical protein